MDRGGRSATVSRPGATQRPGARHLDLEPFDGHHRRGCPVERPAQPTERDRTRTERRPGVRHDRLEVDAPGVPLPGQNDEQHAVGRQDDQERAGQRLLAQPGRVVLEVMETEPVAGEALEQPRGEPEQPDLLRRGGLGREVVGVVGMAARGLDLVGVAVAPDAALAEQPVGRAPREQEEQRCPPAETEEDQRRRDAAEEHGQPLGDEVHVHEHRRAGPSEVEVARRGQVVGEVAALEVADTFRAEGRGHQPVVEHGAEVMAEQRADDLVQRRGDLRRDEHDTEGDQGCGQVGAVLDAPDEEPGGDRQAGGDQRAHQQDQPPRGGEPGHRSGQDEEEPGGRACAHAREHPRRQRWPRGHPRTGGRHPPGSSVCTDYPPSAPSRAARWVRSGSLSQSSTARARSARASSVRPTLASSSPRTPGSR